jgi:hypothetical protein
VARSNPGQSHPIKANQTEFIVFFAPLRLCVIGSPPVRPWKIKRQDAKAQRRKERQQIRLQSESIAPNQTSIWLPLILTFSLEGRRNGRRTLLGLGMMVRLAQSVVFQTAAVGSPSPFRERAGVRVPSHSIAPNQTRIGQDDDQFGNQGFLTEGNEVNEEKADYGTSFSSLPPVQESLVVQNRTQSHLIKPLFSFFGDDFITAKGAKSAKGKNFSILLRVLRDLRGEPCWPPKFHLKKRKSARGFPR